MVSIGQIRAARGFLGWSQGQLARAAAISRITINRAESGEVSADVMAAIVAALEKAGVVFVEGNGDGPGVRLKTNKRS